MEAAQTTQAAPTSETQAQEAQNQPSWFIDEKTPGQGDRPDWLPGKYKSAADVGKAYVELEKKLGAFTGAPDNYDLSGLEIDENQHLVKELTSVAKEMNMSQEGLQKLLGRISAANEIESQVHLEEQIQKLGPDGEAELNQFKHYAQNYFKPEEAEVISSWVKTAEDLKTFNRIMSHSTKSSVPTSQTMAMLNPHESVADIRREMAKDIKKYQNDKAYAKTVSLRLAQAAQREGLDR